MMCDIITRSRVCSLGLPTSPLGLPNAPLLGLPNSPLLCWPNSQLRLPNSQLRLPKSPLGPPPLPATSPEFHAATGVLYINIRKTISVTVLCSPALRLRRALLRQHPPHTQQPTSSPEVGMVRGGERCGGWRGGGRAGGCFASAK
jgi:hypothetical protein